MGFSRTLHGNVIQYSHCRNLLGSTETEHTRVFYEPMISLLSLFPTKMPSGIHQRCTRKLRGALFIMGSNRSYSTAHQLESGKSMVVIYTLEYYIVMSMDNA